MIQLLQCLGIGLIIGVIFTLLRLPVPVPHGWGGLLGLAGMFVGGEIAELIISHIK